MLVPASTLMQLHATVTTRDDRAAKTIFMLQHVVRLILHVSSSTAALITAHSMTAAVQQAENRLRITALNTTLFSATTHARNSLAATMLFPHVHTSNVLQLSSHHKPDLPCKMQLANKKLISPIST